MPNGHDIEPFDSTAQERYLQLRASGLFAEARRVEMQLREARWTRTVILWRTPDQGATRAARQLYKLDLELRRAAAIIRAPRLRAFPHPVPLADGRLDIAEARIGSFDLVLEAVGLVSMALLSNPVQLTLTTRALVGDAIRVAVWLKGRHPDHQSSPNVILDLPHGERLAAKHRLEIQGYRADGSIDRIIAD